MSRTLLLLSLSTNVLLGAWWVWSRPTAPASVVTREPVQQDASAERTVETKPDLWSAIVPDDGLPALPARLRAAGFPEPVVRGVVKAMVAHRFELERAKVDRAALNTPFWERWPNSWLDPAIGPELRRLGREEDELLKQLLGEGSGPDDPQERQAYHEQHYGRLEGEKLERLQALEREMEEKRISLMSPSGGMLPASRAEKLAVIEREMRSRTAEFLSPEEANEYFLRNGRTAGMLNFLFAPASISEAKFRVVHPLFDAFTAQFPASSPFGANPLMPDEQRGAHQLAVDALVAQMAQALGTVRAEELKQAMDPQYAYLSRLTNRLSLPGSTTKQLVDLQVTVQRETRSISGDTSLTTDQRNERLRALAAENMSKVSDILGGAAGLEAFHTYTGNWLLNLGKPKE